MSGGIYLIQDDAQLVEMKEQAYDSEALLQRLQDQHQLLVGSPPVTHSDGNLLAEHLPIICMCQSSQKSIFQTD